MTRTKYTPEQFETPEQLANAFVEAYKAYRAADVEYRAADALLDEDDENPEYEAIWNAALDKVHGYQVDCIELLYIICSLHIDGFTPMDANRMLLKYDDKILSLVNRLAR